MASWDVFHADRLEVERSLDTAAVRQALARGDLRDDDLVRPAGTTVPWTRLADLPDLLETELEHEPAAPPSAEPEHEPARDDDLPPIFAEDLDEEGEENDEERDHTEDDDSAIAEAPAAAEDEFPLADLELIDDDLNLNDDDSLVALDVSPSEWERTIEEEYDPQDEDEAAAEFTLSRGSAEKVEELDLAAMVDVAFQLVLFFLVTATTVLYKSLEVPKPNADSPAAAAAQGHSRSLDDLQKDYVLVEIDATGVMKIDHEPVTAEMAALVERLRDTREKTGRKAMLLTADFATPHRNAVLAYDAANEIGMGIAIARPSGTAPTPAPAAKTAGPG